MLISTNEVHANPVGMDEGSSVDANHPYETHRCYLEQWVRKNCGEFLVVRLPALFGENLKKNFIYDFII